MQIQLEVTDRWAGLAGVARGDDVQGQGIRRRGPQAQVRAPPGSERGDGPRGPAPSPGDRLGHFLHARRYSTVQYRGGRYICIASLHSVGLASSRLTDPCFYRRFDSHGRAGPLRLRPRRGRLGQARYVILLLRGARQWLCWISQFLPLCKRLYCPPFCRRPEQHINQGEREGAAVSCPRG
jgi:hypothetical protein